MGNVLALPHALVQIQTGNNEDWIESFKFVVDDGSIDATLMPQFDLRGMRFEMEVRRKSTDHEVVLSATTDNQKLSIGAYPNYGFLLLNISINEMKSKTAGSYVADMIASDEQFSRNCMTITLDIVQGVTR